MIKRISEHKSPKEGEKRKEKTPGRKTPWPLTAFLLALGFLYLGTGENAWPAAGQERKLPVYSVEREDNKISISFDAAWGGDKTREILDILDEFGVHATFFLVDTWTEKFPDLVKEIDERGHEIGNHSTTHPHMTKLTRAQIGDEMEKMSRRVSEITGKRPRLFRAPYGEYDNKVIETAREKKMVPVQWSKDSLDWQNRGAQDVIQRATGNIQKGDIVLFHNDSAWITRALPEILKIYREKGLEVVPISQLLLPPPYEIDFRGCQKMNLTKIPEVAE